MSVSDTLTATLMPTGKLRAAVNVGNPILANLDAAGASYGVSVDLACGFAQRLGVELELVMFDAAGKSVEAVTQQQVDFGFFAIDPVRGAGILFTAPYVLIEGAYLVHENSPLTANHEVDREAHRVVVGEGSAYELFLTRELKHATILRSLTSPAVVDNFITQSADVAAGVRQQLEADAKRLGGLRLLPKHFMVIEQAMGIPKVRGEVVAECLRRYVEDMKASGFVADALDRHGIEGAVVASASA